jgi:hypothetical protein
MKSTKLALVTVLLFGTLSACNKSEPATPAAEAEPAAAEPAATPAPPPVVPEVTSPETTEPASTELPKDDGEETDDTPHSGGDKVGTGKRPGN